MPGKQYKGKRGAKGDPAWKMIGPKGNKTRFFRGGKKLTYGKALRMRGKSSYRRFARVYVLARLHALDGVPVDARTSKALIWADRYFAKTKPGTVKGKRVATSAKAKKQRRAIGRHAKSLKRFSKGAKHYKSPSCGSRYA